MNRKQRRAAGRFGAAPALGSGATATPGTLAQLFGTAVARHQAGALAEAERQYRHILTRFPAHADSLHNLGLIALQTGNAAAAVELIGKAIAVNNRIAEFHYNIAGAFRLLNQMDQVAAHLERAVELRGDHALAHLNLGNVRREQGRLAEAAACCERAIALDPNSPAASFNLGTIRHQQGRWDEAIACFERVLGLAPGHADTHSGLGTALLAQGKIGAAIPHLEQAVACKPNVAGTHEALAKAYMLAGKPELAIGAARGALELNETEKARALFAQCVKSVRFTADDGRFRRWVLRALVDGWERPRELSNVCISLIQLNPAVSSAIARANAAWPARLAAAEPGGSSALGTIAQDELLCRLLEYEPVTSVGLERLLTGIRYAILTSAAESTGEQSLLGFYCAVARQCFINEYVFALTNAEAEQAQQLRERLEAALAAEDPIPALWPVAVAAYFPLHMLAQCERLLQRPWPRSVAAVIAQQVEEPAEERRIAAALPALTDIEDDVSRTVRRQYEESPYPRWIKAAPPRQLAALDDIRSAHAVDMLVAGCGTGLSSVELARQAPEARILAIDLSLASLSYAKRLAQNLGLANLEFAQADILKLGSIGRQFDFIDASGVLHHLAAPWEGFRVLLSLLRPGGAMQVGLYSRLGRRNIQAARALVAERGFRPVAEDIRRCRQEIIAADDPLLKSIVQWKDFFATSECRDLLFHVQEHQITIPEIKAALAENDVQFGGFVVQPETLHKFVARFPEAALTNLDCWHAFETGAPETFIEMYQFWVRKPAARSDEPTATSNSRAADAPEPGL